MKNTSNYNFYHLVCTFWSFIYRVKTGFLSLPLFSLITHYANNFTSELFFFFILAILKFNFHFVQWWKIILFEMYTANEIIVSRYIKFSNLIISSVIFDIYFEYFSTWKSLSRYFSIDKKFKRTSIASTWTKISMKVMYEYFVLH